MPFLTHHLLSENQTAFFKMILLTFRLLVLGNLRSCALRAVGATLVVAPLKNPNRREATLKLERLEYMN